MPIFIGDVHADWNDYNNLIRDINKPTMQVGDFGIGFESPDGKGLYDINLMEHGNHFFGRGNHDNPEKCKSISMYVADGTLMDNGVFWVGGALSIDRSRRIEGRDWWSDEELSIGELGHMINLYEEYKPDIVATHDCPEFLMKHIGRSINGNYKSRTQQAFDSFREIHKPRIHVFGHHHMEYDNVIEGTRYICVPIMGVKEV